jgi:hypothetical protein
MGGVFARLSVPSTEFILSAAEGLRTWLGAINFLTRFVKQFAGALHALTPQISKSANSFALVCPTKIVGRTMDIREWFKNYF